MAEAAIEKIKKDILSCCICSEELRNPIGLPCLHGFCYECLHTWHQASQDKTQVVCPACKKPTPVPEGGIGDFPRHTLVKDLKETVKMESAESKDTCHICRMKAEVHCSDCNKSFCHQCQANHDTFIKDHFLVTIEELNSGQISTEGRVCQEHGEKVRYYCETEEKQVCVDCVGLSVCSSDHKRLTLKEAARKQTTSIDELMKRCEDNQKMFEDAVEKADSVLNSVNDAVQQKKTELVKLNVKCVEKLEQMFAKQFDEVEKVGKERVKHIEDKKKSLVVDITKMKVAKREATDLKMNQSEFSITYKYPSMSKELNELCKVKPAVLDESVGFLRFEIIPDDISPFRDLVEREEWKLACEFSIDMEQPRGIALNNDGDIAVTSFMRGVKVFSRTGQVKCSFMEDCMHIACVAVSLDNRYVVANGACGKGIQFHTKDGNFLNDVPVRSSYDKKTDLNSVAVDANGVIIAGHVQPTISIHNADGTEISKFATEYIPLRLTATSHGDIICSFRGGKTSVELMDYSGQNICVLQPPPDVYNWVPGYLCCRKGEIFVSNTYKGNPPGIFRYTSKGQYLSCVTTDVQHPQGLALSKDGMELYVVDHRACQVKIFHQE